MGWNPSSLVSYTEFDGWFRRKYEDIAIYFNKLYGNKILNNPI